MKKGAEYSLIQTDVTFGDALCKLYRFEDVKEARSKALNVPILHTHPFFEGMICTARSYRVKREEDSVLLLPASLLLVAPGVPHCAEREGNTAPISFGVLIEKHEGKRGVYRRISERLGELAERHKPLLLSKEACEAFEKWAFSEDSSVGSFCLGCVLAYHFLYLLFRDISAIDEEPFGASKEKKVSTGALLDTLLDDRRYSLKEISEVMGYTRRHMLRIIKQRYGCDFRTVKRKKAVEAAKAYLISKQNMTINEVADALGYESESAFYAFFKRETGSTPREYRAKCADKRETVK